MKNKPNGHGFILQVIIEFMNDAHTIGALIALFSLNDTAVTRLSSTATMFPMHHKIFNEQLLFREILLVFYAQVGPEIKRYPSETLPTTLSETH
ncbi:MAG: hypothetical protein MZW92_02910 [Comamonadaceae bacterium]|nr:hypothetical protein [Comamonadaceae bacterium]